MRIISGKYRGRRYSGAIPAEIRPTTDNARESIFNILSNHLSFEGKVIADICAGTGFLGFEALSRGTEYCYFFEKSSKSIALIQKIASQLSVDNFKIFKGDAYKKIKSMKSEINNIAFDLIFFDPPYQSALFNPVIGAIADFELLKKGGIFVVEQSSATQLIIPDKFHVLNERKMGDTKVLFLGI